MKITGATLKTGSKEKKIAASTLTYFIGNVSLDDGDDLLVKADCIHITEHVVYFKGFFKTGIDKTGASKFVLAELWGQLK